MSSYSYLGTAKVWTPRDEEDARHNARAAEYQSVACAAADKTAPETPLVWRTLTDYHNEKWSVKRLMRLLRLYGAHRCLWDTRDPDNRNRKLRQAALVDITAAMGEGVSRGKIIQKINVLRATYRYEKRRIKQRIRRGIGAKTKLKWFALADAFLRHVPRTEKSRRDECADTDSDLEDAVVFSIDPESLIPLEEDEEFECSESAMLAQQRVTPSVVARSPEANSNSAPNAFAVNAPIKSETAHISRRKWTAHESLQFVYLLRAYPLLWQLPYTDTDAELAQCQQSAVTEIAQTMQLPATRVQNRLHTFLNTYRAELEKVQQDGNYKPNLVWWPMALEYSETLHARNAAAQQLNHIKCEQSVQEADVQTVSAVHVEKVPSSTSPAPYVEAAVNGSCSNSDSGSESNSSAVNKRQSYLRETAALRKPPMKLIWNGLEDDLLEGKWSLKHSVKFLRLYGAHRCLWDLNDQDYRSRELRSAAIKDIAAAMGYGLDADYVAKKIKIFRITYMQHRKRMLEALKACRDPDVQLRWFPLADSFLRPHIGLRSIKQHERELPQFDFQYVYANLNLIDPALLADMQPVSVSTASRRC